jgi:hypothetical protein
MGGQAGRLTRRGGRNYVWRKVRRDEATDPLGVEANGHALIIAP